MGMEGESWSTIMVRLGKDDISGDSVVVGVMEVLVAVWISELD